MPRRRIIDPEFWSDEEIGHWSHSARLFYIGLWNFADDEGRFKANSMLLKSQIFPYDEKVNLDKLKEEIENKIQWYEEKGLKYGHIKNFLKHQRIDRPSGSKLPIPPPFVDSSKNALRTVLPKLSEVKLSKEKLSKDKELLDRFVNEIKTQWNKTAKDLDLATINILNSERNKALKQRFDNKDFIDHWKEALSNINSQPFLLGDNDRKWKIDFDFFIGLSSRKDASLKDNYIKILEKKYKKEKYKSPEMKKFEEAKNEKI